LTIYPQTRNSEKYSKNKDRNKQRAIDLERTKVRIEAVRQAERLAAKYDPTGKKFNVDAVIILADGTVKSVEKMRIAAERQAAEEAAKKEAEQKKLEESVNLERQALIQGQPKPKRISKKQQKRQAMLEPRPVPPKPILPEGISIPEGEEDFISQWDISDEGIQKRLSEQKKRKSLAGRALRRKQKEESKFRKAMKLKKKEADRLGILFDADAAKKEILGLTKKKKIKKESSDGDSDSESLSESDSDSGSEGEEEAKKPEEKPVTDSQKSKKAKKESAETVEVQAAEAKKNSKSQVAEVVAKPRPIAETATVPVPGIAKESKKSKRSEAEADEGEPKTKRSKKSSGDVEMSNTNEAVTAAKTESEDVLMTEGLVEKKRKKSKHSSDVAAEIPSNEVDEEAARKERKRLKKEKKHQEELANARAEANSEAKEESSSKKSKKRKLEEETDIPTENGNPEKPHKEKKAKREDRATSGHSNGAEQWNPDELPGDEARKDKFLRLLGAGKTNGIKDESSSKKKPNNKSSQISQIEAELERQYEAGMKLKHDGQGKRRGLGA
jgi:hypothetical protein